jgi:hypothetical protein
MIDHLQEAKKETTKEIKRKMAHFTDDDHFTS